MILTLSESGSGVQHFHSISNQLNLPWKKPSLGSGSVLVLGTQTPWQAPACHSLLKGNPTLSSELCLGYLDAAEGEGARILEGVKQP